MLSERGNNTLYLPIRYSTSQTGYGGNHGDREGGSHNEDEEREAGWLKTRGNVGHGHDMGMARSRYHGWFFFAMRQLEKKVGLY